MKPSTEGCKGLPLKEGLSKNIQGKPMPQAAQEKSAYAPLIGGDPNGRGLTTTKFTKPGGNVKGA